ncbi:unnamed protein product [Arctia plantaginis]|uniref:Uncharacterized protein n=1 Tax=Arctia plantaginis TaxID=874455 RepID=A0A8S1AAV0_ARCPL|nr:unnamed protein product [Arctia plantaginis]
MDISDINKVASRKRMNTDAEKLREKVSRETAKIIKLKVAQDTAYWDLKEKLQQLEANHERLQQNMVEVQMQHEAVSGQFQEELRLRPDTLNKLSGTRDICDALEEYGERLRRSVARCRGDQRALGAAYGACGARVRLLAAQAGRARAQLAERRRAHVQLLLRADEQLAEARARADRLQARGDELTASLERCRADLTRREEAEASLREDVARLSRALDERDQTLRAALAEHRRESEEAQTRLAALEREVAETRSAGADAAAALQRCTCEREEALVAVERKKAELAELSEKKREIEKVVDDRDQVVRSLQLEVSRAREQSSTVEAEKRELRERLNEAEREGAAQASRLQELTRLVRTLEGDLNEAREAHATQRATDARKLEELGALVAERERELDAKTGTVARLMADLKGEAQARYRADAALDAARHAHDAERDAHRAALRDKDAELARQLALVLDLRGDKARLEDKLGGMQATIDNVRKELTGPAPPAPAPPAPAERDESAPAKAPRDGDDLLYGFLSDGSVDSDVLDVSRTRSSIVRRGAGESDRLEGIDTDSMRTAREVRRRFSALARGAEGGAAMVRGAEGGAAMVRGAEGGAPLSLSQIKKDFKIKRRTFFKSKRLENDSRKLKE